MSNTPPSSEDPRTSMSREDFHAALFSNMVVQQANMALMLLGKVPHPETGELMEDLDTARMFIDQLEMLEAKTRGNLSKPEDEMLKRALAGLRMAFVEAVDAPARGTMPDAPQAKPAPETEQEQAPETKGSPTPPASAPDAPAAAEESRKKFSKKY